MARLTPSLRGLSHNDLGTTSSTSLVIDRPTGVQNGDVLFAYVNAQNGSNGSGWSASGWTATGPVYQQGSRAWGWLYRVVTNVGAEPSSYTFSYSGTTGRVTGDIMAYTDVDSSSIGTTGATTSYYNLSDIQTSADGWIRSQAFSTQVGATILHANANNISASYASAPTATPAGYTQVLLSVTSGGTSVGRTAHWIGTKLAAGASEPQARVDWASVAASSAAHAISFLGKEEEATRPPGYLGATGATALYVGSKQAQKLYIGPTEIWPESSATQPTDTPSEGLFFKLPDNLAAASDKKVFAHFFGPYPIVIDNVDPSNDYYVRNYLSVGGESGAHAAYGGLLRDRPISNWPYDAPFISTQMHDDIQHAKQAGIDGFFVNIMGSSGGNWDRYVALADVAAANYPGFYVVPMVDANGSMAANDSTTTVAARINTFLSKTSAYQLLDGRYAVGSFKTESKALAWWQEVFGLVQANHGKQVAFISVFNNISQAPSYAAVQYATGSWGPGADPGVQASYTDSATPTRARGEKVLTPVWVQDSRPNAGWFDEARNTAALCAAWDRAISDNADIVQLCTWNDYSEGSQYQPSVMRGHVAADISAYYITRWKTGAFPAILRDAMYVSHRNQMASATITGGQTTLMTKRTGATRSAFREHVEILTFLVAPATVSVKVGGSTYSYTAPAGMYTQTYPMEAGEVSAKAVRNASEIARVNSPVVIKTTATNQDRQYALFSSIRGTTKQFDPTPNSPSANAANYI